MIITHCNNYFVEWTKLYLMSILKNDSKEKVYISGANLTPEQVFELKEIYKKAIIVNHKIENIKIPLRRYMAFRVTEVLLEAWNSDLDMIYIATNADVYLNKPISPLYDLMKTCDVAVHFTGMHMRRNMIQNGVIVFKTCNPVVLEFLKYYNETTQGSSLKKGADQRGLFRAYNKFKDRLQFGAIPHDYIDGRCRQASHMWSGHLKGKWPAYQRFQQMLNIPVSEEQPEWFKISCTITGGSNEKSISGNTGKM